MEFLVLDTSFKAVNILDIFESAIWVDRYNKYGDFEIETPATVEVFNMLQPEYYLWSSESEHMMIIESRAIKSDSENGNRLITSGRSLESILDRRIVWVQTVVEGKLQDCIKKLLNDSIIAPTIPERKIDNFIFEDSDDPTITDLKLSMQFTGDNLYDVITKLCQDNKIGFKITLNDKNQFVFKLYAGVDRSYNQLKNPYVIFSPNYENIINSNYYESKENFKSIALVSGEDEGTSRRTVTVDSKEGPGKGLYRRELFVDARDIQSEDGGTTIPPDKYNEQLKQRGSEKLNEKKIEKIFDGEMETSQLFQYGEDFFMGDIVQVENEYNVKGTARVIELIRSQDQNGYSEYPTFDEIEQEKEGEDK